MHVLGPGQQEGWYGVEFCTRANVCRSRVIMNKLPSATREDRRRLFQ